MIKKIIYIGLSIIIISSPNIMSSFEVDSNINTTLKKPFYCSIMPEEQIVKTEDQTIYKAPCQTDNQINQEKNYVSNELIIKFNHALKKNSENNNISTTGIKSVDLLNQKFNILSIEKIFENSHSSTLSFIYKFTFAENKDISNLIKIYSNDSNILYAEPNFKYKGLVFPNDPKFDEQWGLHNIGQSGGTIDADIDAPEAWDISTGSKDIKIAIIDSGIDYYHPDLKENCIQGYDYVNNDDNAMDDNGHGTHCAGIIGGTSNNNIGITGICWDCTLMPVKGLNSDLIGTASTLAKCIYYAVNNEANIISMSWGGVHDSELLRESIDFAYDNGIILVAAAGSNPFIKTYPAAYNKVIAVASTDEYDERFDIWYYGPWSYGSWVDLAAPGFQIRSTYIIDEFHTYYNLSGTSMSCAFVSGVVALMLSQNNKLSFEKVLTILHSTTDRIKSNVYTGTGRLNACRALEINTPSIALLNSALDEALFRKEIITISGTAKGSLFQNYRIYYGEGVYPNDWILIESSSVEKDDELLASWNVKNIEKHDYYTIKLVVNSNNGVEYKDYAIVYIDPLLLKGWPIQLETTFISASPTAYDFNNDGRKELIIATSGSSCSDQYREGKIYVINVDGSIKNGWPFVTKNCAHNSPAIADITGDGQAEIVASSWHNLYVFKHDGTLIWTKRIENFFTGPVLADIDQDNLKEILLTNHTGTIYAFNEDGSNVRKFPIILPNSGKILSTSAPSIADVDKDGYVDIAVTTYQKGESESEGKIFIFSHLANIKKGWPITLDNITTRLPPVFADINGDDDLEIIIDGNQYIWIFEQDGSVADGWPKLIRYTFNKQPISIGDIDRDSLPEIFFCRYAAPQSHNSYLYSYNGDGSKVDGWPIIGPYYRNAYESPITIVNIDSDDSKEVVVKGNAHNKIFVFNSNGSMHREGNRLLNDEQHFNIGTTPSPLITDLTGDGTMELVAASNHNSIHVWNFESKYTKSCIEWPMYQFDIFNTGCYRPNKANNPPNKPNKPNGENDGKVGLNYTYNTITDDPENDKIWYLFDWGDDSNSGWLGPFESGKCVNATHTWSRKGEFTVKVCVKDEKDAQSLWSDALEIAMPKSKESFSTLFNWLMDWLIERFPFFELLFDQVMN